MGKAMLILCFFIFGMFQLAVADEKQKCIAECKEKCKQGFLPKFVCESGCEVFNCRSATSDADLNKEQKLAVEDVGKLLPPASSVLPPAAAPGLLRGFKSASAPAPSKDNHKSSIDHAPSKNPSKKSSSTNAPSEGQNQKSSPEKAPSEETHHKKSSSTNAPSEDQHQKSPHALTPSKAHQQPKLEHEQAPSKAHANAPLEVAHKKSTYLLSPSKSDEQKALGEALAATKANPHEPGPSNVQYVAAHAPTPSKGHQQEQAPTPTQDD